MTEKILITGSFGYLGGRIAHALSQSGNYHLCLATHRPNVSRPKWLNIGEVVQIDFSDRKNLDHLCKSVKQIIHLAALNEIDSAKNPGEAFLINSYGSLQLLLAAEASDVERFIYFSTAHVYGAPLSGTITERTVPRPVHPYSITHRAAEEWVLSAHDHREIQGVVLRLSNAYGAPEDSNVNRWSLVVNDLCRQAATTRKMVLRSSGVQKRDFIALTDVCGAVKHLLRLDRNAIGDGLFNLGGECAMPVIEVARLIAKVCQEEMGFCPELIRPEPKAGEVSEPLDYRIDKLKATGYALAGNMHDEVSATLKLCLQ